MNTWFRFYNEVLFDPKPQKLSGKNFKGWVNLLCLSSANDGVLPPIADVAFALRISEKEATSLLLYLCSTGLFDERDGIYSPHNWGSRQYKSDSSTERVKRFRERSKTVTVTPPDTDTDTDTEADTDTEKINGHSAGMKGSSVEGEFDLVFWPECPRKIAKGNALKAYRMARKKASCDDLVAGMKRYAEYHRVAKTDAGYIKHPSTWLNGECWLDEMTQAKVEKPYDKWYRGLSK